MEVLLAVHALVTTMMAGLIWFVQLVHYPLFQMVGEEVFVPYEKEHTRRVTWIVAPLMGVEAVTAITLVFLADHGTIRNWCIVGLLLLAAIWVSTAVLQVPCHRKLSKGFDVRVARRLVVTNWLRTLAWTGRAGLAVMLPGMIQS
jgi:hypothetical protein